MKLRFGQVEFFRPDMNFDFMRWRFLWIGISLFMVVASLLVVAGKGLNYSIDFTGGVEVSATVQEKKITREEMVDIAKTVVPGNLEVTSISVDERRFPNGSAFLIRLPREKGMNEDAVNQETSKLIQTINDKFERKVSISSTSISGKIGKEEQFKGYISILLSLIGILAYVAFRFDARFAPGGVICLFHDVIIALGFMTALDRPFSNSSVAAFLTLIGFSINDTIVVYDRIREVMTANPRTPLVDVVNMSINQTMSRTVLTNFTIIMALMVLVFLGGGAIYDFALTMLVGAVVGSYSSIYVAAPLTIVIDDFLKKRGLDLNERFNKKKKERDVNFIPPVVVRKRG